MSQSAPPPHSVPKVFQRSTASTTRLVHLIPDELAQQVPDHPLFSYPITSKPQDGFRDVSSKCFANAINRTSWYLVSLLEPPKNFETVGYMGLNDIRYFLFMFAAIRVGYKMLFLSPRNNLEAHINVLEGVNCQILLSAKATEIEEILQARPMKTTVVPELEALLDESCVDIYPYTKTFKEARMDPCLVLHTTGSTGLPKPITWKIGMLSTYEAWRTIPPVDGYVPTTEIYQQSRRAYTSMPLFHTSGLNAGITWALSLGVTLVYGAPNVLPNAVYVDEMHRYAGVDASMGAPSIYEELSRDYEALERINKLHYVVASGAPLSNKAGALISRHTRVISNLGATETACLQRLAPSINDWAYFYRHPTHSGIEMREAMDGLYELFLVRKPSLEVYQGVFNLFPDIQEWSMKDLYARHPDPSKSFLYIYKCRKDDVIVLSNGEKVAPALMEATLMSDPLVKGAMVVGRGKFQPAALIDLAVGFPHNVKERHEILEKLSPVIAETNEHAPAHGKLDQYHILFTQPNKPIHYLGQGKIQRHRTYTLYENEIEEMYKIAEDATEHIGVEDLPRLDLDSKQDIIQWLSEVILRTSSLLITNPRQDLFEAGLDSLQVIQIARELKFQARNEGAATRYVERFVPKVIYSYPTLEQLANYVFERFNSTKSIFSLANGVHTNDYANRHMNGHFEQHANGPSGKQIKWLTNSHDGTVTQNHPTTSTADDARRLFSRYTSTLPEWGPLTAPPSINKMTVLLTGSTGSLGSYLLETLYHRQNVAQIVCLNRSNDARRRQEESARARGLTSFWPDRVKFLRADISEPQLGLQTSEYIRLLMAVTHIIHNQWPVNFNWSLSSFEPQIRGVRNLIYFSYASTHRAFLLFLSSVSAVGSWQGDGPIGEGSYPDPTTASRTGYGQSKLISENILDHAARVSGVKSAVCRVGIVAGPVNRKTGIWNKHEYIPSIIISSKTIGMFPSTFPSRNLIDWLPVDSVSRILVEILVSSCAPLQPHTPTGTLIYHVVNPHTTTWTSLVPSILSSLHQQNSNIEAVPFDEWLEALASTADNVQGVPAIKLLDFYREAAMSTKKARSFQTNKAEQASETLRSVGAVRETWIQLWMTQWGLME